MSFMDVTKQILGRARSRGDRREMKLVPFQQNIKRTAAARGDSVSAKSGDEAATFLTQTDKDGEGWAVISELVFTRHIWHKVSVSNF